jgi:hypothetical protein
MPPTCRRHAADLSEQVWPSPIKYCSFVKTDLENMLGTTT